MENQKTPEHPKAAVRKNSYDPNQHDPSDRFDQNDSTIRSVGQLLEALRAGKAEIEARVMGVSNGKIGMGKIEGAKAFLEAWDKSPEKLANSRFRETFGNDFNSGAFDNGQVGQDFVPFMGGPFFKQLYYTDYIRMINLCYYASNHDPFARSIINITRDFTLGRGFRIDCKNKLSLAVWRAFEKANNLQAMMEAIACELTIYGETMVWKLPNNNAKIYQAITSTEQIKKAVIPRVRVIDPSCIWDIVTWPEDITNVLYYVWVAATQWQTYNGLSKENVPSGKFIFQTIPADQMNHYKVNAVSNEKRGRSDLFPVLGYLKRLRDAVNFSVISLQKQSSWSIDTTIEGSQADIDAYVQEQQAIGTIPNAGSEFVHTDRIKREMLSPAAGAAGQHEAFEWVLSMISAGTGIPMNYFGTHLSGGHTRASALVATEPSAKKFEMRQKIYRNIVQDLWDYCMKWAGLEGSDIECEITFPEIVVQDRSAKLKDLMLAQMNGWTSVRQSAQIAAKELEIANYDYDETKEQNQEDPPPPSGKAPTLSGGGTSGGIGAAVPPSGIDRSDTSGDTRAGLKATGGY